MTKPIRLLAADGTLQRTTENEQWLDITDALPTDEIVAMHREMVLTRAFDIEAGNLQRQGKLGLWVPSIGQEGGQAGAAFALRDQDTIFPSYREHLVGHVRGVEWMQYIDIFRGATHGGWDPAKTKGFRLYSLVIGTHALHAAGYAMGIDLDRGGAAPSGDPGVDEAVIAFYGDGASSQGDTSEGLVFAASFGAPIVYFVQNNKWAISVPSSVQTTTPLHERAAGFGLRSLHIDGNDALASYAVTRTLLDAARHGDGPGYIEADTYRMGAHTTSDDPTRYRTSDEEESWARRDPITRLEVHLRSLGVGDEVFAAMAEEGKDTASDIRRRTLEATDPPSDDIFDFTYRDPHPLMDQQKRWLADFEHSFGED